MMTTPLGATVEPEVCMIQAVVSGLGRRDLISTVSSGLDLTRARNSSTERALIFADRFEIVNEGGGRWAAINDEFDDGRLTKDGYGKGREVRRW